MRLLAKIFLCSTIIFSLAFLISGYFLIEYSFENSLIQERDFALKQYQYDRFTVQAGMIADNNQKMNESTNGDNMLFKEIAGDIDKPVAFFADDFQSLYSEITEVKNSFLKSLSSDDYFYQMAHKEQGCFIQIGSQISQGNDKIYFVTQVDISNLLQQQDTLISYFQKIYCIALSVGMLLILIFSTFLIRPLKKMARVANRIANGEYEERISTAGRDEISELADSFNQMAAAVEEKVKELSDTAKQKEDFVANFAHELKTPLTAMIGYADMLYQKELSRTEVRKAAEHIWNEGMRLESLSFKLMDMTVLNSQAFLLQEMRTDELLNDIVEGLEPIFQEKGLLIHPKIENTYIKVDYDLFKTLILNIIDNSVKAGSKRIELSGNRKGTSYVISIQDDGHGIPKEELSRITEAFYMVDKSRSRKQHGAGLGLSLVMKIAQIHEGRVEFESEEGCGTLVSFILPCEEVPV